METKKLNFNEDGSATFTVDYLDKEDYIATMKAMLKSIGSMPDDMFNETERYYICNLVSGMLPDSDQITSADMKAENVELKRKNKHLSELLENKEEVIKSQIEAIQIMQSAQKDGEFILKS